MVKMLTVFKAPGTWGFMLLGWFVGLLVSPEFLLTWVQGLFSKG